VAALDAYLRNSSPNEIVSTIVHEATHQNSFFRGIPQTSQYTEYLAFRNEALFQNGVRPSLVERYKIYEAVKSAYPNLPQGKYPFGGVK
jgi:hypothetical protein